MPNTEFWIPFSTYCAFFFFLKKLQNGLALYCLLLNSQVLPEDQNFKSCVRFSYLNWSVKNLLQENFAELLNITLSNSSVTLVWRLLQLVLWIDPPIKLFKSWLVWPLSPNKREKEKDVWYINWLTLWRTSFTICVIFLNTGYENFN